MRRTIRLIVVAMVLSTMPLLRPVGAQTLRFIPLPMQDRETVYRQFYPMTDYLAGRLSVDITFVYCESYQTVLDRFQASEADLAYLGPLPYVTLRNSFADAQPVVRFKEAGGQTTYTCALVTFADNVFDPQFTHDRSIALTQPLSTCGYLSTSGLMRYLGSDIENNRYRYLKRHDSVALAVVRGEFDAGGLKSVIARKYTHMGLQILAETKPLPGFVLVANRQTLTAQRIDAIRNALLALDPEGADRDRLSTWGDSIRNGAVSAADHDYQVVRDLLGSQPIPMEGNF